MRGDAAGFHAGKLSERDAPRPSPPAARPSPESHVLAVQRMAGNRAVASLAQRVLQRDNRRPTIGNLPRDKPNSAWRVGLKLVDGKWKEVRPSKQAFTPKGWYDFVLQNDEIWAVKHTQRMDAQPRGHTEAAQGGRVTWAGQVKFSGSGQIVEWNDGSGHYRAAASFRDTVVKAGFPADKFKRHPDVAGSRKGPQLPVIQPDREPPKTPPTQQGSGNKKNVGSAKLPAGERPKMTGKPTAAALAANLAFTMVLGYLDSKIRNYFKEKEVTRAWNALEWEITHAIDKREAEFEQLLKQTGGSKVIYANIHLDYVERTDIVDADTRPEVYFHKLELTGVGLSTQDISEREGLYFEHFAVDKYTHSLLVYSVPLYDPDVQLWREIAEDQERHPGGHFGPRPQPSPDDFDQLKWDKAKGRWVQNR